MTRRKLLMILGFIAALLLYAFSLYGIATTKAAAAPAFSVELSRDAAEPTRSDERLDYTLKVKNLSASTGAPASAGEALLCAGAHPIKTWTPQEPNRPTNSFQWYRNGVLIPDETNVLYVTTADDAGKAIQCLVRGDNISGSAVQASLPPAVVNPQPAVAPPSPPVPLSTVAQKEAARPKVTGELGESVESAPSATKRFCKLPTNWLPAEGQPDAPTWSYQWLLNSEPIPGATASSYQPVATDESKVLQCLVTATNLGGSAISTSNINKIGAISPNPPINIPANMPEVITNPVTATLELPVGTQTHVYQFYKAGSPSYEPPSDWGCGEVPAAGVVSAKVICASFKSVPVGSFYQSLAVAIALGADAPNHVVVKAKITGGGTLEPAEYIDEFDFLPSKEFGIEAFEASLLSVPTASSDFKGEDEYTQAGGHPLVGVARIKVTKKRRLFRPTDEENAKFTPVEHARSIVVDTPRGFVGNALAVPQPLCGGVEALIAQPTLCPEHTAVGGIFARYSGGTFAQPIYTIEPEFGVPAQFAFQVPIFAPTPVFVFSPRLRADDGYAISLVAAPAPESINLFDATPVLCGYGLKARESNAIQENGSVTCYQPGEEGANDTPLITMPTRCAGAPPRAQIFADSAEHPGTLRPDGLPDLTDPNWKSNAFDNPQTTGCEKVVFEPQMDLTPTTRVADSPSGIDVSLGMETEGLVRASKCHEIQGDETSPEVPECISQANLKRVRVTFPRGMWVDGAKADGLGACSAAQVKLGTNEPISCPDSSKIGTIEIDTPIIQETLSGAMYVAKQGDVDGAPVGLYLVFESKKDGIIIKLPGKLIPNPVTGQLAVTFDESPEDPFSAVRMHFSQGPRSPLVTPLRCGTYRIEAEMAPWSAADPDNPAPSEVVTDSSTFQVDQGPNGGPCPTGALEPKLSAGTTNPAAAKTSPFMVRLHREDGTDRFASLKLTTPPGLTAYLKGIPYCPDSVLRAIPTAERTGQAQIDHPFCPAASQIGTVSAGAGAGPNPFYVHTGRAYLAGPYKGAPLSIAVVTPAVAGPLDLGNVVIRNAIHVDPESAQITAVSDPIPTIVHGFLLGIRDIRIAIDRPNFTRNPTNCDELRVGAEVGGESGATASLSRHFQATGCEKLGFAPKLNVRLFGGTKRGGHPRLKGTIVAKEGEANIGHAAVTIPRSEFLDQAHIRTICTRVQFAADNCPKGSVYGHGVATTPLLDYPVEGPVYLRSSSHKLPDLVVDLKGPDYQPIEAVVVGRIDSIKGQIRTTFETTPDVPISKFVLSMQGGSKGLLVNSRDVCARDYRATVKLEGQNGAPFHTRPAVQNGKCH